MQDSQTQGCLTAWKLPCMQGFWVYIIQNGMGSDQMKIACSHGRSNTLRFATFGDVSNVLSSFLLSMSTGHIFDSLKIAKLARFLGLYHSVCYGQWSRKNCICPRQVKQIKSCHFWWSFKRFIIQFVGDFVLGKMASPSDFLTSRKLPFRQGIFCLFHSDKM